MEGQLLELELLHELVAIFALSLQPVNAHQQHVYAVRVGGDRQRVEELQNGAPEKFAVHVAALLPEESVEEVVRAVAGHMLKAHLEKSFAFIPVPHLEFVQSKLNQAFMTAASPDLQRSLSNAVGAVIRRGGLACWPGLFDFLLENLLKDETLESSMKAIKIILEDSSDLLQRSKQGRAQLATLWAKLQLIMSEHYEEAPGRVKEEVLILQNLLLWTAGVEAIAQQSEHYFKSHMFRCLRDESAPVRREFYNLLLTFLARREDIIATYRNDVYDAIIYGLSDPASEVRLAACNFWPEFFAGAQPEDEARHKTVEEQHLEK